MRKPSFMTLASLQPKEQKTQNKNTKKTSKHVDIPLRPTPAPSEQSESTRDQLFWWSWPVGAENNSCPGRAREAGPGVGAASPEAVTATDYTQIAECQPRNICLCLVCSKETPRRLATGFLPRYIYHCRIRQTQSSWFDHWESCHDKNVQAGSI